jgi:hypothetical protein
MKSAHLLRILDVTIATLALCAVLLCGCETESILPPPELRGDLEVLGFTVPDGEHPDSINIALDGDSLGWFSNPHVFAGIYAGTHLVEISVFKAVDTTMVEYSGAASAIIEASQSLQLDIAMLGLAPDFELYDLDSNLVSMSNLSGQVVLLYFFHST